MAINPGNLYPGKTTAPSADYPFGGARNVSTPGDGTGTPWEAALVNDLFGFQQSLLEEAGFTPSGTPERVGESQYLEALRRLFTSQGVAGVAELRALSPSVARPGRIVGTAGYYAPGDGGANEYVIEEKPMGSADDGGSIIHLDDGVHQARGLFNNSVNIRQWGARGDGTADDRAAAQAAVDWFGDTGGTLLVPTGSYRFTGFIELGSNLVLEGEGKSTEVFLADDANSAADTCLITNKGRNGAGNSKITVRDMVTDARIDSQTSNDHNVANICFDKVELTNVFGVRAIGSKRSYTDQTLDDPSFFVSDSAIQYRRAKRCVVERNTVERGGYNNIGFYEGCRHNSIRFNICSDTGGGSWEKDTAANLGASIQITAFIGNEFSFDNIIEGNILKDNTLQGTDGTFPEISGVILHSAPRTIITGNIIDNMHGEGIRILTHAQLLSEVLADPEVYTGYTISDNQIQNLYASRLDNANHAIHIYGRTVGDDTIEHFNATITGNNIHKVHGGGIRLQQCIGYAVTGNSVSRYNEAGGAFAAMTLVKTANNGTITGNGFYLSANAAAPGILVEEDEGTNRRFIITSNVTRGNAGIVDNSTTLDKVIENNGEF